MLNEQLLQQLLIVGIFVNNASIKEYEIPCPKWQVVLISSVLLVTHLMWY